jgi:hypothetical protein
MTATAATASRFSGQLLIAFSVTSLAIVQKPD